MTRPLVVDAFPFHDELDMLEMRLVELYDVVDWFVLVEADVTHQDRPKPFYYLEHAERFTAFADKIVPVQATGLPTITDDPDSWARELAQREHIATGLATIGVNPDDIIMQSDVDEIPRATYSGVPLSNAIRPGNVELVFGQRGHFWAVDWLWPRPWPGTTVATVRTLAGWNRPDTFGHMRSNRTTVHCPSHMLDAGWHFSWLGGPERATHKVNSFCHPEVEAEIRGSIANDNFYWREGFHVDGERMAPVNVDDEWPKWIRDGNAPFSWFRPLDYHCDPSVRHLVGRDSPVVASGKWVR